MGARGGPWQLVDKTTSCGTRHRQLPLSVLRPDIAGTRRCLLPAATGELGAAALYDNSEEEEEAEALMKGDEHF